MKENTITTIISRNAPGVLLHLSRHSEELPKLPPEEPRRIFELLTQLESQDTHFLTPEESAAIDEAIRSLEAGKGIPASEVRQRFAVISSTNSQIALDEPGTEQLVGRGDLLCNNGRGLVRAQSYFIPQPEFLKLCLNNG